jgi:hypothetical protein
MYQTCSISRLCFVLIGLAGFLFVPPLRAAQLSSNAGQLEKMPPELETRFALSALPPHLRDQASVYVLDPAQGYVPGKKGTNGFSCIVERTEWNREDFKNDVYTAMCYDAEGTKIHLKVWLDVAQLRAKGMSATEVKKEVEQRFKSKTYGAPAKRGLSYMAAPIMRTYPNPDLSDKTVVTMSMPHVMYYAPNVSPTDIGATPPPSPYPFIFEEGPHGYMIQLIGEAEKGKILADQKSLLADLCAYRSSLCLTPR